MRKTTRWLGLLLAFAMLAAACGQGEEVTATTSAPAPEETETTDAPAPEETETTEAPEEAMDVAFDGVSVTDDTIYIGMLADLSGPFATLIKDIVDAEEATFDDYNASGGVAGRWKIETIVEDTGYDVTVHGEKYDELKDKVVAFTQSTGSPHTTSIAAKLVEDNLIAIPLSWYSGWADPDLGENVIEQGPNYCIEAMSMVEWMTDRYRSENDGADPTWGIVSFPGEYGQDGAAGAKYATEALGLEVAYDGEGLAAGSANTEVIAGLVAASPDLVFNTLTPTSLGEIFGGAVQSGLTEAQWGGSGPSYNYALLGSPIGPLLSELYTQSGYYAPYGADVEGMDEVRRIVGGAFPDRQLTDGFTRGYLEAQIIIAALEDAAAAGDLTPAGVTNAAKNLAPIDFGGLIPGGIQSWSGEPNDFLIRAIQIYDIDISLFDPTATVVDGEGENIGYSVIETAYEGTLAAEYDYQGPCFVGG